MAAKLTEDAPRNLHRNGMLPYVGMQPCQTGSQLDPFLQNVFDLYEPFPERRKIVEWELKFFLQIVSDAFYQISQVLKDARQKLCQHGAIYTRGRWCSFNDVTRHYIRQITTPGLIAWYAFAGEHGGQVKIEDDANGDAILKRLSIPALLTVVFREDVDVEIRRSAYKRIRNLLTQVACMYPNMQLLRMPYPVCLIPDMIKMNPRLFWEGAKDVTYSTPLEMVKQLKKYEATEEEQFTDETQVTYSDGKKRDVIGSVEVLGTQTSVSKTIQEDWN